jgi:hypothetical protein
MERKGVTAPSARSGCRAAWPLAILGLLILSCAPSLGSDSAPCTSGRPSYVSARNLEQLVELSTVIAVGRLEGTEGEINLARNADNRSRASDDSYVLGQVYRLRVERYLKGEGPDTIRVVQAEVWDYGGASRRAVSSREAIQRLRHEALDAGYVIPLAPDTTYLLFLRPLGLVREDDYYAGTPQPWRFVLTEDGRAYPDSPWGPADEVFPARPAEELLGEIEQLVEGAAERAFAPLTPVPTPAAAPGADLALLYVHDGDLWRADVSGAHRQRLTTGQPLAQRDRGRGEGCDWGGFSWGCPTHISPNGRWIAQWAGGSGMLLVDVTGGAQGWLPGPVSSNVAWSPDGRTLAWSPDPDAPGSPAGVVELYAYDTERGWVERLFQGDRDRWDSLSHLVWSPDGRRIAFTCCLEVILVNGEYKGDALLDVHALDVARGDTRYLDRIESHLGSGTSLCWTVAGGVTITREEGIVCSPVTRPREAWRSPDGALYASWVPADPEDRVGQGASRLTVLRWDTREVVWERALDITVGALRWSPDGAYLLLDDGEPDTLIWRLSADGAGEPKVVIEAGLVIDVVPQWADFDDRHDQ